MSYNDALKIVIFFVRFESHVQGFLDCLIIASAFEYVCNENRNDLKLMGEDFANFEWMTRGFAIKMDDEVLVTAILDWNFFCTGLLHQIL